MGEAILKTEIVVGKLIIKLFSTQRVLHLHLAFRAKLRSHNTALPSKALLSHGVHNLMDGKPRA